MMYRYRQMQLGPDGDAGGAVAKQQQQQQDWTNQATKGIDKAFSGFTPQFYKGIGQAYQNYALPQLQNQFMTNSNNLGFKMAGQGLQKSSVNDKAQNALADTMSQAERQIGNQAVGQENTLRSTITNQQASLYNQANITNNPNALSQQAIATASAASAPSTFQPIGQMFNTFASDYLGQQQNAMYNQFTNSYLNTLNNPGLYANLGNGVNALPGVTQKG